MTKEEILALTMEEFKAHLPEPLKLDHPLFDLRALCTIGGQTCEYLEHGGLPKNEYEFATKRLLQKTNVGAILCGWTESFQHKHYLNSTLRCTQIKSMREFLDFLCTLGFPRDVDDDESEYNHLLDTIDKAEQERLSKLH